MSLGKTESSPLLELKRVGKKYTSGPNSVDAISNLSLTVEFGEFVAIRGSSGSGKSTLLNLIGLLDAPTSGSLSIEGVRTETLNETSRTALRGRRVGFIFQSFNLLMHRTVADNVALSMMYLGLGKDIRHQRTCEVVDEIGLGHKLNSRASELSGGERQRVAIARALAPRPAFLLCDEPTGNLDSRNTDRVMDLFQNLNANGTTVIFVTHDPLVSARADRIVTLDDGQKLSDQPA